MDEKSAEIFVGTCGWSYNPDWVGVFYPGFLPNSLFLEFYSSIFNAVEIDSSFYFIPKKKTVENWAQSTPEYFRFSSKLNQNITHKSKLDISHCKQDLHQYLENLAPIELQQKQIAHLVQLPPSFIFPKHLENFESFLNYWTEWKETKGKEILKQKYSNSSWQGVIEFRNSSWLKPQIMELLSEYKFGYCAVIEPQMPPDFLTTWEPLFYLRFHGFGKNPWWNYQFNDLELTEWAERINNYRNEHPKTRVAVFFNNHFSGYAVKNALDLLPKLNMKPNKELEEVKQIFQLKYQKKSKSSQKKDKKLTPLEKWMIKKK